MLKMRNQIVQGHDAINEHSRFKLLINGNLRFDEVTDGRYEVDLYTKEDNKLVHSHTVVLDDPRDGHALHLAIEALLDKADIDILSTWA